MQGYQPASRTSLGRTITGSGKPLPLVQIAVHPGAAVKCYAVSEVLPVGLTPLKISGDGVFSLAADLDGNGRVDLDDYFLLASHWNEIGEPE